MALYQFEFFFKIQGIGGYEGRKFVQGVFGYCVWVYFICGYFSFYNRVQEYCRLCDLCLFEVFGRVFEYYICNVEIKDIVGLFKQCFGKIVVFVQVFVYIFKLGSLAGENVGFYGLFCFEVFCLQFVWV